MANVNNMSRGSSNANGSLSSPSDIHSDGSNPHETNNHDSGLEAHKTVDREHGTDYYTLGGERMGRDLTRIYDKFRDSMLRDLMVQSLTEGPEQRSRSQGMAPPPDPLRAPEPSAHGKNQTAVAFGAVCKVADATLNTAKGVINGVITGGVLSSTGAVIGGVAGAILSTVNTVEDMTSFADKVKKNNYTKNDAFKDCSVVGFGGILKTMDILKNKSNAKASRDPGTRNGDH